MFTKPDQPSTSYSEELCGSEAAEKTIPFLRRLVDMLSENENVISFCPGSIKNGEVTLGRIVVHDRIKVENEILPRYFNHSSFASLRRQLNYFSFTRIGKGRQKGATYCNEGVIVIEDILRLRRRSTNASSGSASDGSSASSSKNTELSPKRPSVDIAFPRNKSKRTLSESSFQQSFIGSQQPLKKARHGNFNNIKGNERALHINAPSVTPTLVSPITSPIHTPSTTPNDALQVTLDLTVPRTSMSMPKTTNEIASSVVSSNSGGTQQAHRDHSYPEDPDILAGCRALLCFSHGLHSLTV